MPNNMKILSEELKKYTKPTHLVDFTLGQDSSGNPIFASASETAETIDGWLTAGDNVVYRIQYGQVDYVYGTTTDHNVNLEISFAAFITTAMFGPSGVYRLEAKWDKTNVTWDAVPIIDSIIPMESLPDPTGNEGKFLGVNSSAQPEWKEVPAPENADWNASSGAAQILNKPNLDKRLYAEAAAPDFSSSSTYFVGDYVTYLGRLYKCTTAVTTAGSWTGSTNWTETDMSSPDATLDIMNTGGLRVVGADGSILWMQGYDLEDASGDSSSSMASLTLSNESVKGYEFVVNSTDVVSLVLPSAPSGKVGDFVLDVTNPSIGNEFSESSTYSSGTQVLHDGGLYSCTSAVSAAGSWTGSTNWSLVYGAFNSSSSYASGDTVIYDNGVWKCIVATDGDWTGTANWQTASFIISGLDSTLSIVVPGDEDLDDMLTFAPGTMCEFYFTQTAFQVGNKTTWKVVRQDVVNGGAS